MQSVLYHVLEYFGNRPSLRYQAQGFPQFSLKTAYDVEKKNFKKTVKIVPISEVPARANIISSHVLYKLKTDDDLSLKLKAGIASW